MDYLLEGVLLSIVGFLGLLGNTAAVIVFNRQRYQLVFHTLMSALSTFDSLHVLASLLVFALPHFLPNHLSQSWSFCRSLPLLLPLAQIGLTGSTFLTVAVALERYLTVCHPFFRASGAFPTKVYLAPTVAFALLYNAPRFFELEVEAMQSPTCVNVTKNMNVSLLYHLACKDSYTVVPTELRLDRVYVEVYCGWANLLVHSLLPFALLLTLNGITLRSLLQQQSSQRQQGPNRVREVQLAKVSCGIAVVFVVCQSFRWVPNIFELYQLHQTEANSPRILQWPPWVEVTSSISHLLSVVNSSANFYVYLLKHPGCFVFEDCNRRRRRMSRDNMAVTAESIALT